MEISKIDTLYALLDALQERIAILREWIPNLNQQQQKTLVEMQEDEERLKKYIRSELNARKKTNIKKQ